MSKFCPYCNGKVRHANNCVGKQLQDMRDRILCLENTQVDMWRYIKSLERAITPMDLM